jgi:hypothetical protein
MIRDLTKPFLFGLIHFLNITSRNVIYFLLILIFSHVKIIFEIQSIHAGSFWIKHRRAWLK